MTEQTEFTVGPFARGVHIVTRDIIRQLPTLPETGLLHLFVKHTSCGLTLCENADPDVRTDLSTILDRFAPDGYAGYLHTLEGPDDMPAHAKSMLTGTSLTIPITGHRLNLGTWQGIALCEFRNHAGPRHIVATIVA